MFVTKSLSVASLIVCMLLVSGCASLSKSECNQGDWAKIGSSDARKGKVAKKQLKKHQSACSKYSINPNNKIYYAGYARGLNQFCRREVGYNFGSRGSKYLQTCQVSQERNFLTGYIPGLETAMDELQSDLDDLLFERDSVDRRLDSLLYLTHGVDHHPKKNKRHKKRVRYLESRLDNIQTEISSKRSEYSNIRSWHSRWILKMK